MSAHYLRAITERKSLLLKEGKVHFPTEKLVFKIIR